MFFKLVPITVEGEVEKIFDDNEACRKNRMVLVKNDSGNLVPVFELVSEGEDFFPEFVIAGRIKIIEGEIEEIWRT